MIPVGTRVRSTEAAGREMGRDFAERRLEGIVIRSEGHTGNIHVDWGPDFRGHSRESTPTCTGHCYFMGATDIEIINESFPIGAIVENVSSRALGTDTPELRRTRRGTVIANSENFSSGGVLSIHVRFDDSFTRGHTLIENVHPGHCYYFDPSELRIASMPTISNNEAMIPRLRVTIARNPSNYNQWTIKVENGPIPTKYEVKEYMEPAVARRLGSRTWGNDLNTIIHRGIETYGVDPQVFIDAVTAASLAKQARDATGTFSKAIIDSDLQQALNSQPALIAIGDQLFTLQPRGAIKATRALNVIRERIGKAARLQADRIKATATAEASGIVANAERQLREARATIERERRSANNVLTLPTWVSDNHIKVRKFDSDTFKMAIGIPVETRIESWQLVHHINKWRDDDPDHKRMPESVKTEIVKWTNANGKDVIPLLDRYHMMTVWMPFDPITGRYSYISARIDDHEYFLPHIGNRCCMELQGLPAKITSIGEYEQVKRAINRGNKEVNLMSLLANFNFWHPDVQSQCPANLKKIIDEGRHNSLYDCNEKLLVNTERTPVEDEAKETFDVDRLRESRTARGESLPDLSTLAISEGVEEVDTEVIEEEDYVEREDRDGR